MQLDEMPSVVLDFIDFYAHSKMNVRTSAIETISEIKSAKVKIQHHEVIIIDEKPKTIFTLTIAIENES